MVNFFCKWNLCFFLTVCIGVSWMTYFSQGKKIDSDLLLDFDVLLKKHGYPVERHMIETDDGYLLDIFRLPHGKNGSGVNPKPVLMMHGLFGTAYNFVYTEYFNVSKAGYFADHGYDVWLGHTRGTTYGRKHVKLHPNDPEFWKFSFHEIALHDLPAMMDYILYVTKRKSLFNIGHSQGGTLFYILASLRPEYQKKFAQVSLTAPAGFMANSKVTVINALSKYHRILYRILPMMMNSLTSVCFMQNLHYAQNIDSGRFRQWDYGKEVNLEIYGLAEPPDYPVEKIEIPVAIYYGNSDHLTAVEDQEKMCHTLKNCTKFKMGNQNWKHFDFLASKNSERELFAPMMEHMNTFQLS